LKPVLPLEQLIRALKSLPGVGHKSASRIAFHLLQHDPHGARNLSLALVNAVDHIKHCTQCYTLTDRDICSTCTDDRRDATKLCVVETPSDQMALERTGAYQGLYFVLMGKLNPLDGVGLKDIGMHQLLARVDQGQVREVIVATNFTAEGEATAHVIAESLKIRGVVCTRLSRGVPIGSELEYVDLGTIAHALVDRR
jgi:recombination protein RecR